MSEPPQLGKRLCQWGSTLTLADVPDRIAGIAASQVLSQLAAVRAGTRHPLGRRLIVAYGHPLQPDPSSGATVTAALGSWLNLDDTGYAGHLGAATVSVPVAFCRALGLDGQALLTAVVAANEFAARITAAATLGPLRGQSALHCYLAGAIAGRLHCEAADAPVWSNALGLGFSAPQWPIMHGFLGSEAKALHALTPVRSAMDACSAAAAGLAGAPDILEHPDGFLERFSDVPLPDELVIGLGTRWHTDTLSMKLRPGGPGIDAAVDCCLQLHAELVAAGVHIEDEVAEIGVDASIYTLYAGDRAERYLDGAHSPLSALLLSAAYPVATALLTGCLTVEDFAQPAISERRRWLLASRVRLRHDPALTRKLFQSCAPFGEAVRHAGPRAVRWLHSLGGPELAALAPAEPVTATSFRGAAKQTPARVEVRLHDGRILSRHRDIPIGGAGAHSADELRGLVRQKFLAQGGEAVVADELLDLPNCSARSLAKLLERALTT